MQAKKEKQREYQKSHYNKNKEYYKNKRNKRRILLAEKFQNYKSTCRCKICGENDPVALDFHHVDPDKKEKLVTKLVGHGNSWDRIMAEIEKCVPLCANCHRKVHAYPGWANKLKDML